MDKGFIAVIEPERLGDALIERNADSMSCEFLTEYRHSHQAEIKGVCINLKSLIFWTVDRIFAITFDQLRKGVFEDIKPDFELSGKNESED